MGRYRLLLLRSTLPALCLVSAWTLTVALPIPCEAQTNKIEGVVVFTEGLDQVAFDVVYSYNGDHGANVSISVVVSDNGRILPYHPSTGQPGGRQGRNTARVPLFFHPDAPSVFSTNQIQVAMHAGDGRPFVQQAFHFFKTWSRPGASLQPVSTMAPIAGLIMKPPGATAPGRRVLPDGSVEVRYPDGRIEKRPLIMPSMPCPKGYRCPDTAAQSPTPPSAPPDATHARWLASESERLLEIMRLLVGNDTGSVQAYLSQEGSRISSYQQISSRTQAIELLVRP